MTANRQENPAAPEFAAHSAPSTAAVRCLLETRLPTDADLDAFCLDYFPKVHREMTSSMQRTAKFNLLLTYVPAGELLVTLKDFSPRATMRPQQVLDAREQRNRQRMIEKVRKFWIEGVLEKSLHGTVMIELGKEYRPNAVAYPWDMVLERPDATPVLIAKGKKMIELFDENLGELLILGAPGSGKTTMLLDLCRDLLKRAEEDELKPIPVVFNLSSWSLRRLTIEQWLIEELNIRYDLPREDGANWIYNNKIIILLDGLDEVDSAHRSDCVGKFNSYRENFLVHGAVVCSRQHDYQLIGYTLKLHNAIILQPLTLSQMDQYLSETNIPLTYRNFLFSSEHQEHEALILRSPLALGILALVSQKQSSSLLKNEVVPKTHLSIFDEYVVSMLRRRRPYSYLKAYSLFMSLSWVASLMQKRNLTLFRLEDLQPSLLNNQQKTWLLILSRFSMWTCAAIANIPAIYLGLIFFPVSPHESVYNNFRLSGAGIILFVVISSIYERSSDIKFIAGFSWSPILMFRSFSWRGLGAAFRYGWKSVDYYARTIASGASVFALFLSVLFLYLYRPQMRQMIPLKFFISIILIPVLASFFFVFFMAMGFLINTICFIARDGFITSTTARNNNSNRNLIRTLILLGISFFVNNLTYLLLLYMLRGGKTSDNLWLDTIFILISPLYLVYTGLIIPMGGGIAVFRHIVLRLMLRRWLPLRLINFFEECTKRILLLKVGGGYIFIHRLLMEYFASLTGEDLRRLAAKATPWKSYHRRE